MSVVCGRTCGLARGPRVSSRRSGHLVHGPFRARSRAAAAFRALADLDRCNPWRGTLSPRPPVQNRPLCGARCPAALLRAQRRFSRRCSLHSNAFWRCRHCRRRDACRRPVPSTRALRGLRHGP
eukprot:Amastigsp_a843209_42.p2 type:complete len:124 gc:universal Amastigsp_a843209_42:538-167(-)